MTALLASLRPFLTLPEFLEVMLAITGTSANEKERLLWIRDKISLPLMKQRLNMAIAPSQLASLEVESDPKVSDRPVGGYYDSSGNRVVIHCGYQGGQAEAVVTHEYTHNWQSQPPDNFSVPSVCNSLSEADQRLLLEGFAEWVTYKILQARGHVKEMRSIDLRDGDEYGDGFDFYQALEASQGQAGVFNFLQNPNSISEDDLHSRIDAARAAYRAAKIAKPL